MRIRYLVAIRRALVCKHNQSHRKGNLVGLYVLVVKLICVQLSRHVNRDFRLLVRVCKVWVVKHEDEVWLYISCCSNLCLSFCNFYQNTPMFCIKIDGYIVLFYCHSVHYCYRHTRTFRNYGSSLSFDLDIYYHCIQYIYVKNVLTSYL